MKRLKFSAMNKSEEWTETQFMKILQELKKNKCRDPHGLVNEIFKPKNIGQDLFNSLFKLLKKVKAELMIPEFMKHTDIHTVYKGKGEKTNISNTRAIFVVNIFRALIMKLVYETEYDNIAPNISDANVGAHNVSYNTK